MNRCTFIADCGGQIVCTACGRVVATTRDPASVHARCPGVVGSSQLIVDRDGKQRLVANLPTTNHQLSTLWDFAAAAAAFVADGCRTVDAEEYRRRLAICDACPSRAGIRCGICRCFLALKARGRAWSCPIGKWRICAKCRLPATKKPTITTGRAGRLRFRSGRITPWVVTD